jgi:hypothetical protein
MSRKYPIGGIGATTHIDRHGERFTKEALDIMANDYAAGQLMFWNHETNLPPIGIITAAWVEERDDGEYQLRFEGHLFEDSDIEFVPQSDIQGLSPTMEELESVLNAAKDRPEQYLKISYDPRNFDEADIDEAVAELGELIEVRTGHYVRKAELPQPVLWILIGYAAGRILDGFLSRIGEMAADELAERANQFIGKASAKLNGLAGKAKPPDKRADIVFAVPLPDDVTVAEGVLEEPDEAQIGSALGALPRLFALAAHIVERNRPGYFSRMSFLFNPTTGNWEINYLVLTESKRVIQGPRYFLKGHPLRGRYERVMAQLDEHQKEGGRSNAN